MRKILYNIALLATIVLCTTIVACEKQETHSMVVPSESILVSKPGDSGTTTFTSHNISSIYISGKPAGWTVDNIDMYERTITVTSPSSFDNGEVRNGSLSLLCYTPTKESELITIHLEILENSDIDYTSSPANCYIASQSNTRYKFNPYIGGNDIALNTASVGIIWESEEDLIKYLDLRDGVASFYVSTTYEDDEATNKVTPGNALIGAYDQDGRIIWSWHIWVTDTNPEQDVISLNSRTLMNRNLGANRNSNGKSDGATISESYGLYYQWGSKNPIVGPETWDFVDNEDKHIYDFEGDNIRLNYEPSSATVGTIEWSTLNPMGIITGNPDNDYDWLYASHDNTLWQTSQKSNYDPCPAGWRVPDCSIYENLTITATDDNLDWQSAQPMYGWNLEDTTTGQSHFFSAAGRRNYLDGRLDIVNDDPTRPIPWSGYYWTSTTIDGDAAAMYFDLNSATRTWNGFEVSRAMHRANALPVRCVKE